MDEPSASVPFRQATTVEVSRTETAPVNPDQTKQSASSTNTDAPPSLYEHLEKAPYAMQHLGLKELYSDDKDFQYMREQATELDAYVLEKMKARGMKDSAGSYKEVIDALYKEIGKSANEDPGKSLRRLSTAAGAFKRLQAAKMPSVLDAKSLTPSEYEDILL